MEKIKLACGGKKKYYKGGKLDKIASNVQYVDGNTHEKGGVKLNNEIEVEDKEVIVNKTNGDSYVYSDRLGYANLAKKLAKEKGKLEKSALDEVKLSDRNISKFGKVEDISQYNTLSRNLELNSINANNISLKMANIDKTLDNLFNSQEKEKELRGITNNVGEAKFGDWLKAKGKYLIPGVGPGLYVADTLFGGNDNNIFTSNATEAANEATKQTNAAIQSQLDLTNKIYEESKQAAKDQKNETAIVGKARYSAQNDILSKLYKVAGSSKASTIKFARGGVTKTSTKDYLENNGNALDTVNNTNSAINMTPEKLSTINYNSADYALLNPTGLQTISPNISTYSDINATQISNPTSINYNNVDTQQIDKSKSLTYDNIGATTIANSNQYNASTIDENTINNIQYNQLSPTLAKTKLAEAKYDVSGLQSAIQQGNASALNIIKSGTSNASVARALALQSSNNSTQQLGQVLSDKTNQENAIRSANVDRLNTTEQLNTQIQNQSSFQNEANRLNVEQANTSNRLNVALSNQQATNQASQFNIGTQNEINAQNAQMLNQAEQFNASNRLASGQFNISNENEINKINSELAQQTNQFNASNTLATNQFNSQQQNEINIQNAQLSQRTGEINAANQLSNQQFNVQQDIAAQQYNTTNKNEALAYNTDTINNFSQYNASNQLNADQFNASQKNSALSLNAQLESSSNQYNNQQEIAAILQEMGITNDYYSTATEDSLNSTTSTTNNTTPTVRNATIPTIRNASSTISRRKSSNGGKIKLAYGGSGLDALDTYYNNMKTDRYYYLQAMDNIASAKIAASQQAAQYAADRNARNWQKFSNITGLATSLLKLPGAEKGLTSALGAFGL